MTNEIISINPDKIKIDEAGRVIMEDLVLAKALVRVKDLNLDGTLSCDVNFGTCVETNVGKCGNKLENIEVSSKFSDFIKVDDIMPIKDINDIREHILRDRDSSGGPNVRPL